MVDSTNSYKALVLHGAKTTQLETFTQSPLLPGQVRVRLGAAGICGTDLHYYKDYGNAGFLLKNPVTLGHEAAGTVAELGPGVEGLAVGDKVVVNPVMNCGVCPACRRGQSNLCEKKRYPGSATTFPHVHGFFRELFETEARCCFKVPADADLARMAFVEPLACSLHAVEQAGVIAGRKVLVTGAGPIGTLAAAAAKACGAGELTITDLNDEPLVVARKMGADRTVNVAQQSLDEVVAESGLFDVAIEASGSPQAFAACIKALRKGGTLIQVGILPGADVPVAGNQIMLKELTIKGSNQYTGEFERALQMIQGRRIDVMPMLTSQFTLDQADEAFALAADRRRAMKVQFIA
ncbi:MAG: L-idonate 5-dehydrogenase [Betaproteobacteria bacterium]